ncbi:DNA primase [Candidatus Gracilibacteria bacterium]|nr:DNA primase [Candidatus Gracilibacteria bacterium]
MNNIADDIESRIDIVELVREYVPLKKSGANWKGLSPFKPEKTPSFVVSPAKQIAYCFGTNQGGGPLRILMLLEKIEFREALQILAKRAGVELKTDTIQDGKADEKSQLIKLYNEVSLFYQKGLQTSDGLEARNYIAERGLSPETVEKWGIGYSHDPREMYESMRKKGFSEKMLMDSGIFISAFKDRFYGRLMFPICNYRGDVIAFSGRTLRKGTDEAKYVNSPETPIFHKSDVLFGIDRAKRAIGTEKKVIVVEGQMDVISLHQAGIENAVGISGTALTESHIRLIRRLTDQVYLCLDRDSAGKQAIFRSIENLQNEPVDIYVVNLGEAKDPDEFLKSGGDFHTNIKTAVPALEFMIEEGSTKYDITTNQGKKALLQEILTHIRNTRGSVEVDQALRLIARKLDMSLQTLYSEYNRAVRGTQRPSPTQVTTSTGPSMQEYLATYIIGLPQGKEIFQREYLFPEELPDDTSLSLVRMVLDGALESDIYKAHELRYEELSQEKKPEILEGELREIINNINQNTFRKLQKKYAGDIQKLQNLLIKAKQHRLI